MQSAGNPRSDEYLDFCGEYQLDFQALDKTKYDKFVQSLNANLPFTELLRDFDNDLDLLAMCAVCAFSVGSITRSQAATFLEYRSMKRDFPEVKIMDLFDSDGSVPKHKVEWLDHFIAPRDRLKFLDDMRSRSRLEQCFFSVSIPLDALQNPRLMGFLNLSSQLRIIKLGEIPLPQREAFPEVGSDDAGNKPDVVEMIVGSVDVRDALTKARYCEHAKALYHKLGVFGIEAIQASVINYGRYAAIEYPGIESSESFHQIEASTTFLTLHDELHRRLISSIYNPLFESLLHGIEVVRACTEIRWSREIWDAMDMEVGEFLPDYSKRGDAYNPYEEYIASSKKITSDFMKLLSAKIYTQNKPIGLFTPSPYIDTTWILIIDYIKNPIPWNAKGINFDLLDVETNSLGMMYHFALAYKNEFINEISGAKQVAIVKSLWFDLPFSAENDIRFAKEKSPSYLEVQINGEPIVMSKKNYFSYQAEIKAGPYNLNDRNILMMILYDPDTFDFVINCNENLVAAMRAFPEYHDKLMERVFVNHIRLVTVLSSVADLDKLAYQAPAYKDKLMAYLYKRIDRAVVVTMVEPKHEYIPYLDYIPNVDTLIKLIHEYPDYRDQLVGHLLASPELFKAMIHDVSEFEKYVGAAPHMNEVIFAKLMKQGLLQAFIEDKANLRRMEILFSEHGAELKALAEQLNSSDTIGSLRRRGTLFNQFTPHTVALVEALKNGGVQVYIDKGLTSFEELLTLQTNQSWVIDALRYATIRQNILDGAISIKQLGSMTEEEVQTACHTYDQGMLLSFVLSHQKSI